MLLHRLISKILNVKFSTDQKWVVKKKMSMPAPASCSFFYLFIEMLIVQEEENFDIDTAAKRTRSIEKFHHKKQNMPSVNDIRLAAGTQICTKKQDARNAHIVYIRSILRCVHAHFKKQTTATLMPAGFASTQRPTQVFSA